MGVNATNTGSQNTPNQGFNKVREGAAKVNPFINLFHNLGQAGEGLTSKIVGGTQGEFLGQALFNPIGAGLSFSGDFERQRDIAEVDPAQSARLREINRTRKQISSGTDALTQQRISEVKKAGETTKGQLAKFSGGDVGGTISSFLRAQRNVGKGANAAFQQGQARIPFFENLSTQLGNRIAQRKLELNVHDADQRSAEIAQAQTIRNLNREGNAASGGTPNLLDIIQGINNNSQRESGNGFLNSVGGGTGQIGGGGVFGQGISSGNQNIKSSNISNNSGNIIGGNGQEVGGGLLNSIGTGQTGGNTFGEGVSGAKAGGQGNKSLFGGGSGSGGGIGSGIGGMFGGGGNASSGGGGNGGNFGEIIKKGIGIGASFF